MRLFNKEIANKYVYLCAALLLVGVAGAIIFFIDYQRLNKKNLVSKDGKEHGYFVYPNTPWDSLFLDVKQKYNVLSERALLNHLRAMEFTNLKEGYYEFPAVMGDKSFIHRLMSGHQTPIKLRFTNQIRNREQLAGKLGKRLLIDSAEIKNYLDSTEYISQFGMDTFTVTSMFIPNTYEVYWTMSAEQLFERMHREYNVFWNDERTRLASEQLGLTPIELTTLASIAESETNKDFEYPIIARLYLNRLRKHIPLQACPTVIFAWGDFKMRRILDRHLKIKSPYNTYDKIGLPPGPIRLVNPGTIDAILHSEPNNYLYMCANPDFSGTHVFSTKYKDHIRVAHKYQRELNKRKIKK